MKAQEVYTSISRKIYAGYRFYLLSLGALFIILFLGIFIFHQGALFMIITSSIVGIILLGFLYAQHMELKRLENFLKKSFKKQQGEYTQLSNLYYTEGEWLFWDRKKGKSGTLNQIRKWNVTEGEGKNLIGSHYPVYKLTLTTEKEDVLEVIVKDRKKIDQMISCLNQNNPIEVDPATVIETEVSEEPAEIVEAVEPNQTEEQNHA